VHLELPEDIAGERVEEKYSLIQLDTLPPRRPVPDKKSIQILVEELEKYTCPVILVGSGANRKRVTKYLTAFIEKYNIPYFTSQMGK